VDDSDVSDDETTQSNVTSSHDHMTMSFMMGKKQMSLELDRNENIPQLAWYYTIEKGEVTQWPLDEELVNAYSNG